MQCIFFESMNNKRLLKIRYEDLIKDKEIELNKILNFLKIDYIKKNKSYFLPDKYESIHKNIKLKNMSSNSQKYLNRLGCFENLIFIVFCYHYLVKFKYINKKFLQIVISFPIHLIFKCLFFFKLFK